MQLSTYIYSTNDTRKPKYALPVSNTHLILSLVNQSHRPRHRRYL